MSKVKVKFYNVSKCGFYKYGEDDPEFGSLSDLISQLEAWSKGKLLGDTKIIPVDDGDSLPVYLFGIDRKDGYSMITMWNEVPATSDNKVASVAANDTVGKVATHLNDVKKGTIPGFPTYFFMMPGSDCFATIRIDGIVTAQKSFQGYCEQFLATRSSYAVKMPVNPDEPNVVNIFGYRKVAGDVPNTRLHPKFRTSVFKKPAVTDLIVARHADIRKIHRRSDVSFQTQEGRATWQSVIGFMSKSKPAASPKSIGFRSSINVTLSEQETKKLIAEWSDVAQNSQWDDYGFQFKSDSSINWLSGSSAQGEVDVDGVIKNAGVVDTSNLLAQFIKNRVKLDKMLK